MALGEIIDQRKYRLSEREVRESRERFRIGKDYIQNLFDCLLMEEIADRGVYSSLQRKT